MRYFISATTFVIVLLLLSSSNAIAQDPVLTGEVIDAKSGQPLPGVHLKWGDGNRVTSTNREGQFHISNIPSQMVNLTFTYVGYQTKTVKVRLDTAQTRQLTVKLTSKTLEMEGVQVTALRPGLEQKATIKSEEVEEANPRDSGELLREISGVSAVRRGPVGLDPVIRGLRETEVGVYLEGTRIFPGGPARMDSPLSHLDPSAIKNINVVKGPYALTLGAGNMSAIDVETRPLTSIDQRFGGQISSGYDHNFDSIKESATLRGRYNKLGYWIHGAWREGSDYKSGNGTNVPADFLSREIRGKIGYDFSQVSSMRISAGYQDQDDIEYPGRLLNADYFHTTNLSANYNYDPRVSSLNSLNAQIYVNDVRHGMDNDGKPTAEPQAGRMPPFAIDVIVDARVQVAGGSVKTEWKTDSQGTLTLGTDMYSAEKKAVRTIRRSDNQMMMFEDLMWPDARITDWGSYAKIDRSFFDDWSGSATIRFDYVRADADSVSSFFRDRISQNLDATEANMSGSATLNYTISNRWDIGIGLGSVVRTADATERYSDRIPSSKSQMSAEFVGNPQLDPERSSQADLWLNYHSKNVSLSANVFGRLMKNYITLATTNLPKRLPLSPSTVYRYVNGSARFWGGELTGRYKFLDVLQLKGSLSYLYGQNTELDAPALGVAPLRGDLGIRYEMQRVPIFLESTLQMTSEQDRTADWGGELQTNGYTTIDFLAGIRPTGWLSLQVGVENATDAQYINHLNSKNPFNGQQIPEPGRVIHADLTLRF